MRMIGPTRDPDYSDTSAHILMSNMEIIVQHFGGNNIKIDRTTIGSQDMWMQQAVSYMPKKSTISFHRKRNKMAILKKENWVPKFCYPIFFSPDILFNLKYLVWLKNSLPNMLFVLTPKFILNTKFFHGKFLSQVHTMHLASGFRFSVFFWYFLGGFCCFFVRGSVRHNFPLVLSNKFLYFRQFIYSF